MAQGGQLPCVYQHYNHHHLHHSISQGKMILHYGDLIDGNCLVHIINTTKPTEIYNLGAQSHVKVKGKLLQRLVMIVAMILILTLVVMMMSDIQT